VKTLHNTYSHTVYMRSTTIVTRLSEHDVVTKSLLRGTPRLGLALGPAPRSCFGYRAQVLHWAPRPGLALGTAPRSCIGPRAQVLHWAPHLPGLALRTASPGVSFAPKRTSTLGSLNEATMSTRLHTARQVTPRTGAQQH